MTAATAESLGVPEIFNVATYFVDRNVALGRGTNVAIECGDKRITYEEVLRNVNRCGNALRRLGVRPEERVLLLLLRRPRVRLQLLRRDQDRRRAGAAEHAVEGGGLPVRHSRFARDGADRQRGAAAADPEHPARRARRRCVTSSWPAAPAARQQRVDAHAHPVRAAARAGRRRARGRADAAATRRRSGSTRQAAPAQPKGLRAPAARHGGLRRAVRQGRARHPARPTAASASRSCSSRTGWATRCPFRSRSARRRSSGRARRRRRTSTPSSRRIGRRCSSPCRPATG